MSQNSSDNVELPVTETKEVTVALYLAERLKGLGLGHYYGVAGNYVAPFLDVVHENRAMLQQEIVPMPNEICAGYAAEAYARKGARIGAVFLTYGVGCLSAVVTAAGAQIEMVPVVYINGAPTSKEMLIHRTTGLVYSHMNADAFANLDIFRRVCSSSQRITNALEAPYQIDAALAACKAQMAPVYLEVAEDVWRFKLDSTLPRSSIPREIEVVTVEETSAAVQATETLLAEFGRPLLWFGLEIDRLCLSNEALALVDSSGSQFYVSVQSKGIIHEDHPLFRGTYNYQSASNSKFLHDIAKPRPLLALGVVNFGKDTSNQSIVSNKSIIASRNGVLVGSQFFPSVPLKSFIQRLIPSDVLRIPRFTEAYSSPSSSSGASSSKPATSPPNISPSLSDDDQLTYDFFFDKLGPKISKDHVLVSDASFPLLGAQNVKVGQGGFVAQASWLAIGYSLPAAVGIKHVEPTKRPVVVIGDGAFQETCQAYSNHRYSDTIVFVLDNGIYGVEQKIVDPSPFREGSEIDFHEYNKMHRWQYHKAAKFFQSGVGHVARNARELEEALDAVFESKGNAIVWVQINPRSVPYAAIPSLVHPGEDEVSHPQWPPRSVY